MRVVRSGKKRHGKAILAGGDLLVEFESGPPSRHEHDNVEPQIRVGLLGGDEVAVVNRVESPAHDTQAVLLALGYSQDGQPQGLKTVFPVAGHAHRTWPSPRI